MRTALTALLTAAAATAALAITPAAASAAAHPRTRRIEWRHSGLCLTAESASAGSPVVLARCGHGRQRWDIAGRRITLHGARELLAVGPAALVVLAGPHTSAGRHARWRYDARQRALVETWWTRRVGRRFVLRWRPGTIAGRQPWMDWQYRPQASQDRWRLLRA